MAIHELSAMTWEETAALDVARAVAILPVGATEAHGPHLPISTDVIIAEAMARAGAARLSSRGLTVLLLPPLAYAPAPFAAGFAGTIGISAETMTATVRGIMEGLSSMGVPRLVIANSHLDPTHIRALIAARDAGATGVIELIFPDITRRALAARLTDEFRSGACHAGQYETSIVMAARPDLVKESRMNLPAVNASLSDAIRNGQHTFEEAGGDRAYFGNPSAATAEEGARTIDALGCILEDAVMESISR